jgi:hypothetical protein
MMGELLYRQVQHILASTFASRCVVWDLRKNDPIIKVSDSTSRMRCKVRPRLFHICFLCEKYRYLPTGTFGSGTGNDVILVHCRIIKGFYTEVHYGVIGS